MAEKFDDETAFWIRAINYNKTKSEWDKGVHAAVLQLLTRISELEQELEDMRFEGAIEQDDTDDLTEWALMQLLKKITEQIDQIDKTKKEYFEAGREKNKGFRDVFGDWVEEDTYPSLEDYENSKGDKK